MSRTRVLVCGANGTLGKAVLRVIGPDRALAASRYHEAPIAGYDHIRLREDGGLPSSGLERCYAVINAAGRISGTATELHRANVELPVALAQAARNSGVQKFVQASSFSVYGGLEAIGMTTSEKPCTEYGRSKALGDRELLRLETPGFLVEVLRLPLLFSDDKPSLFRPLLGFATRARILPVCQPEPLRSMMTYDDAAKVLVDAASDDVSGIKCAADPQPFTFSLLARIAQEEVRQHWQILSIPAPAVGLMRIIAPGIARRLFQSSFLMTEANRAGSKPLGLEAALRSLVSRTT